MERFYLEAFAMGLLIGIAALLINTWVGDASWPRRVVALVAVGGLLCLVQFAMARVRRKEE